MHPNKRVKLSHFHSKLPSQNRPILADVGEVFKFEGHEIDPKVNESVLDWDPIFALLREPDESDPIRDCIGIEFDDLVEKADEYFSRADKELHVFPFKDIKLCWHRLYTDTSIVKAIRALQYDVDKLGSSPEHSCLDRAVQILDMAMITTGGFGREELLEDLYRELETVEKQNNSSRLELSTLATDAFLLPEEHSVPRLTHPLTDTLHKPTLTAFEKNIRQHKEPILLTGILDHWSAVEKWQRREYWLDATFRGRRLVPVEIGRSYVDSDWSQQIISFEKFLNEYILNETDSKGYLAQYDLFHHLPRLNQDIATPDYCFVDAPPPDPDTPVAKAYIKGGLKGARYVEGEVQKNIWFGPAWTISPLHHDPYHNILCQVVGKKYIRLYSPQTSSQLHPRSENEAAPHGEGTIDMSNTSSIDVAAMETSPHEDWDEIWPGVSEVPYQEIILEAGQALYIPVGWWHYVRSCSVGISVSFWWL